MKEIMILNKTRTPIGSFLGTLSSLSTPKLNSITIKYTLETSNVTAKQIKQIIINNILQTTVGQTPTQQTNIGTNIPTSADTVTINKVYNSGMKAMMFTTNDIRCGKYDLAVANDIESMSNKPYTLTQTRT